MKWRWEIVSELLENPVLGAELGVRAGKFTEHLLAEHPGLTMIAVDTWAVQPASKSQGYETYKEWDFNDIRKEFDKRTFPYANRVKVLHMDTLQAAREVADSSLDFIFIDAQHTYEAVSADIDAWLPKIKPGGLMSGHDYKHVRFPGVTQAVNERFTPNTSEDHVWWTTV